jgi:hypothetical protein
MQIEPFMMEGNIGLFTLTMTTGSNIGPVTAAPFLYTPAAAGVDRPPPQIWSSVRRLSLPLSTN